MNTKNITVYDPAMCCSTGVCGPELDPALARFAADLEWLAAQGVRVRRFNLAQEPGAFVVDAAAKSALERQGAAALPLVKAGDAVVSSGVYPSRAELATWAGLGSVAASCCAPAEAAPAASNDCCGPVEAAPAAPSGCCSPSEAAPDAKRSSCC